MLIDFETCFIVDFSMSDAQREHAATVEQLIPGFADLRVTVCNSMTEEKFWMVYFLLLLPRLNEDDFELLSTPKASFFLSIFAFTIKALIQFGFGDTGDQLLFDIQCMYVCIVAYTSYFYKGSAIA